MFIFFKELNVKLRNFDSKVYSVVQFLLTGIPLLYAHKTLESRHI